MKNFVLILMMIVLTHCGYSAVYKNQEKSNLNITIKELKGDKSINNILRTKLRRYSSDDSTNIFTISAETAYSKSILSKDKTGRATDLKLSTSIKFIIMHKNKEESFLFSESLNIDNSSDFYEQNNYENNIKNNFVNEIIGELIIKLNLLNDY